MNSIFIVSFIFDEIAFSLFILVKNLIYNLHKNIATTSNNEILKTIQKMNLSYF